MSESQSETPGNVDRGQLERLYDQNPDDTIQELLEFREDSAVIEDEYTIFQALANEDRIRLLEALREGEFCGCELMVILDAPQSTVATHLRKLRQAGLVKCRKKGKWNYYRIADTAVIELLDLAKAIEVD
ncbi:ArsR/SmtB family transcription factor [Halobacterium wangiae]|uniref:ArsR/SmtB family transcription factor n=1 Tax=Halobacterium wangiae TaxID=2902623 RepID=UPI001E319E4C|nr:metalloregulator ArsR/SmtB family transcription factor [Halobacterium wangiae]